MDGEYWQRDDLLARLRMEASINQGNAKLCGDAADEIERLRAERQELWRAVSDMKAAAETAGLIFRNTDSGPNLVRLTPQ